MKLLHSTVFAFFISTFMSTFNSAHAESSFSFCRTAPNERFDASFCIRAEDGYKSCRKMGFEPTFCLMARGGFADCVTAGFQSALCLNAPEGFKECLNEGFDFKFCSRSRARLSPSIN